MTKKITFLLVIVALASLFAVASPRKDSSSAKSNASANASAVAPIANGNDDSARIEGEKRFRANCGRCHAAPQKFPPRMMSTIVRHMRVRATITDEDMKYILSYMTQ